MKIQAQLMLSVGALLMIGCQGESVEDTTPTPTTAITPTAAPSPTPTADPTPTPTPTAPSYPNGYVDRVSLTLTTFIGNTEDDQAGQSFTTGDFNGDGTLDFAIGADSFHSGAAGQVYIVFGPVEGDVTLAEADVILRGEREGDTFGVSVLNLGDTNGDGIDDLAVGADQWSLETPGAVYLFDSPHTSEDATMAEGKIQVSDTWDGLGLELYHVQTLVAGHSDGILVTSIGANVERNGEIHIFPLELRGDITQEDAIAHVFHSDEKAFICYKTELLADMNGDGIEDLATTLDYDAGVATGALILYGPLEGSHDLANADAQITTPFEGEPLFNLPSLGSGDLDKDGHTDLLVSTVGYDLTHDPQQTPEGSISIYEGALDGAVSADQASTTFYGPRETGIGQSMLLTEDLDDDGLAEIITTSMLDPTALIYTTARLDNDTPKMAVAFGEKSGNLEETYYFQLKPLPDLDGQGRAEVGLTIFTFFSSDPSRLVILSGERLHTLLTTPPEGAGDSLLKPRRESHDRQHDLEIRLMRRSRYPLR